MSVIMLRSGSQLGHSGAGREPYAATSYKEAIP